MAFAACIPLGGLLSDISPPQWWFLAGFAAMSGLTLGNSFVHDKELLLALRALQGICAALTMPASYSMIVHMFPDNAQQERRLIGVLVVSAVGTFAGFIFGALFSMAHWRWIFRFLACLASACAVAGWLLMPKPRQVPLPDSSSAHSSRKIHNLRKLDLIGVFLIMGCLLLFNLALTNATVYGWSDSKFIAPFIISVLLLPTFCIWEAKQEEGYAILPTTLMKNTVFLVLCFTGIAAEIWGSMSQIGGSRYFTSVLYDSSIVVAGKLSVQAIGLLLGGLLHTFYIAKKIPVKYRLLACMTLCICPAVVLLILSGGGKGMNFWRFIVPGYFVGAFCMIIVFQCINVCLIRSVPAAYSGIASSVFQMCAQTGIVIGSSVQAGLYNAAGDGLANWRGSQYGFYFLIGWLFVAIVCVQAFLPKSEYASQDDAREESRN